MKRLAFGLGLALWASAAFAQVPMTGGGLPTPTTTLNPNCTEGQNFLARTSGLDATHTNAYKQLICGLVFDGVWSSEDILYVFATQDATTANLNLVSTSFTASPVASPTFTTDRGYTGNGSSSYVNTTFNPATAASPHLVRNSAHISVWDLTSRAFIASAQIGATNSGGQGNQIFTLLAASTDRTSANGPAFDSASSSSAGFFSVNRSASSSIQVYINGSQTGSSTTSSSVAVPSASIYVGARNVNGTTGSVSSDQIAFADAGASLTAPQQAALYARVHTFLQTVGATP